MQNPINFLTVPGLYGKVVNSFIEPIQTHLGKSKISKESIPNSINLHFFLEEHYRKQSKSEIGTSVFMSHGLADKGWWDINSINTYDYVCVPGPLWMRKMIQEGIPEKKILMVGYPKLDPLYFIKKEEKQVKKVLWAPTHNNSISSYPQFNDYLNQFPVDFVIESSLHPQNKQNNKPTFTELAHADIVIADSGSLLYEAWALNIPVIFPDWLVKEKLLRHYPTTLEAKIYRENIGYHATSFEHLIELIYRALQHGVDQSAKKLIDEILPPSFRGNSGKITAEKLLTLQMKSK